MPRVKRAPKSLRHRKPRCSPTIICPPREPFPFWERRPRLQRLLTVTKLLSQPQQRLRLRRILRRSKKKPTRSKWISNRKRARSAAWSASSTSPRANGSCARPLTTPTPATSSATPLHGLQPSASTTTRLRRRSRTATPPSKSLMIYKNKLAKSVCRLLQQNKDLYENSLALRKQGLSFSRFHP